MEALGRVALCTQGLLYVVVGVLALQVAFGDNDSGKEASQDGALAAIARQPFGKVLLIVMIVGLLAYALWRLGLAVRGDPDPDEDGKSAAKRVANVGRAAIYAGFIWFAVQIVSGSKSSTTKSSGSGGGGGDSKQKSTAIVLDWPAGRWIVVAAGLVVAGGGGMELPARLSSESSSSTSICTSAPSPSAPPSNGSG